MCLLKGAIWLEHFCLIPYRAKVLKLNKMIVIAILELNLNFVLELHVLFADLLCFLLELQV